jgi:hypothetical protein
MEFLFPVVDQAAAVDAFKAGDIIDYHPDGWPWTQRELTNPNWRIVRVDVLQSTVDAFMSTLVPQAGAKGRQREYQLVLASLPNPSDYVGARAQGIIPLTRQQVVAAVVKKS